MGFVDRLARALVAASLLAVATAAAGAAPAETCRPALPLPAATQPPNLGVLKLQLLDYKCLGDYDRDVAEVAARARAYIEERARHVNKPAIVLDIDETSLSNWPHIVVNDFGFISHGPCQFGAGGPEEPCGFHAWVTEAKAEAIKPTLELFNAAKAKNVAVFFISARCRDGTRRHDQEPARGRLQGLDRLILRPKGIYPSVMKFKTAVRGVSRCSATRSSPISAISRAIDGVSRAHLSHAESVLSHPIGRPPLARTDDRPQACSGERARAMDACARVAPATNHRHRGGRGARSRAHSLWGEPRKPSTLA